MELLTISDNKVIPSAYTLTIPEFKAISIEELAYVYYMCDHASPFAVYDEERRSEEIQKSIFKGTKKGINNKLKVACDKYKELTETSAVKLLKSAKASVTKLEKYFKNIDLTLVDDNGRPIFHAKDLVNNLEKMGKVVDGLTRLEEIVRKEEQAANTNRGGIEVNKYSM